MLSTAIPGWELSVDRGPDCLLVKINGPIDDDTADSSLLDSVWHLLEQHFTYRLVIELDDVDHLNNRLIEQLVSLAYRVVAHGGILRLCGLSPHDREELRRSGFANILPVYRCPEDAMVADRCHHATAIKS